MANLNSLVRRDGGGGAGSPVSSTSVVLHGGGNSPMSPISSSLTVVSPPGSAAARASATALSQMRHEAFASPVVAAASRLLSFARRDFRVISRVLFDKSHELVEALLVELVKMWDAQFQRGELAECSEGQLQRVLACIRRVVGCDKLRLKQCVFFFALSCSPPMQGYVCSPVGPDGSLSEYEPEDNARANEFFGKLRVIFNPTDPTDYDENRGCTDYMTPENLMRRICAAYMIPTTGMTERDMQPGNLDADNAIREAQLALEANARFAREDRALAIEAPAMRVDMDADGDGDADGDAAMEDGDEGDGGGPA